MIQVFFRYSCICFLLITTSAFTSIDEDISVAKVFSDNMVVQQGLRIPVWGYAQPGVKIKVRLAGNTVQTSAGNDRRWVAHLPAMPYSGPHVIQVSGKHFTLNFTNVMVGEVWLASGQSNMEFSVGSVVDAENVATQANFPMIREFRVPKRISKTPLPDLDGGNWKICDSENVREFSAVAYFFAQAIHLKRKVAIGIIHASWGGTPVEAWTSADKLKTHADFQKIDTLLNTSEDWVQLQALSYKIDSIRDQTMLTADEGIKQRVHLPDYADANWQRTSYPIKTLGIKAPPYSFTWFRKTITISDADLGKDFKLLPGQMIESNIIYFNGVEIGRGMYQNKSYPISKSLIRSGKNVIAIRLLSQWGNGQLGNSHNNPMFLSLDSTVKISLEGEWLFNSTIEPPLHKAVDYQNMPSVLFNAMINPLIPYPIKGVIWYQGETNSGRYNQYKVLQPLLFNDWRTRWKLGDFPFLFVQLPGLVETSWQWMREAQAASLNYPNTGMAVSIDVGDAYDLHPRNKKPIGERLALLAQKIAYGENLVSTGPSYKSSLVIDTTIHIQFNNVGSGLISSDNTPLKNFLIAGKDHVFYKADARIVGDEIIVRSPQVGQPVAVRYAWEAIPTVNFYNKEGLPAVPFRTDDWHQ